MIVMPAPASMFFNDFKVLGAKIIRKTTLNLAKIPFCAQTAVFSAFARLFLWHYRSARSARVGSLTLALREAAVLPCGGLGDEKAAPERMPLTTLKLFIYGSLKQ